LIVWPFRSGAHTSTAPVQGQREINGISLTDSVGHTIIG
jgi:hypothetical protein